jgi:type I restriction enzyme M protein
MNNNFSKRANFFWSIADLIRNDFKLCKYPDVISNIEIGYIFEEIICRFNEAPNENPREHFTPRDVILPRVNLLHSYDTEVLSKNYIVRTIYDPCCDSGGMLTISTGRDREGDNDPRERNIGDVG